MRGQVGAGVVTYFVVAFAFVVFLALGGYQLVNLAGSMAVASGSLTGVEAFFFSNLLLWVVLALIISLIFVGAWGLRQ